MSIEQINIRAAHGEHDGDISATIASLSLPEEQLWSWYEPCPGGALNGHCVEIPQAAAAGLHPILRPGFIDAPDVPMDEARLFWPCGGLYLVAESDRTRWALWVEGAGPLADKIATACGAKIANGVYAMDEHPILLQQNIEERFGLDQKKLSKAKLHLRKVLRDGAVVGWTLFEVRGKDHG